MSQDVFTRIVEVGNPQGLHARPARELAILAGQFNAKIEIVRDGGERIDCTSTLGLLTLAAEQGTQLRFEASGPDAQQAIQAVADLVDSNFHVNNVTEQEQT